MKNLNSLYIILIMLLVSSVAAQDITPPDFTPPYPNSADLGKYGNMPIGLHTGSPAVNLEIYTLKEGPINLPISLSYSSSGVQVDAAHRQLGIDWQLIAGGVITREVRDRDDFGSTYYLPSDESSLCYTSDPSAIALTSNVDSEKDIFNFSAMGISGKFILDNNLPVQLEPSGNKISYSMVLNNGITERVFKIVDVQGTQYFFGEYNAKETSMSVNYCGSSPTPGDYYETAWYLSRVKLPTGQEMAFTYSHEHYSIIPGYSQTASTVVQYGSSTPNGSSGISVPCNSVEQHNAIFLSTITTNDKKITFDYTQLETSPAKSKQLQRISIFWNNNSLLKKFDFDYYLVTPNPATYLQNVNSSSAARIFLKSVVETGATSPESIMKYYFDYYSPELLPPRFSYSKDIYGYYNDAHNTNMVYNNLGTGDVYLSQFSNITTNRDANPLVVHYGMLHDIIYPTGGKTELIYESNSVYVTKTITPPPTTVIAGDQGQSTMNYTVYSANFTPTYTQQAQLFAQAQSYITAPGELPACSDDPSHAPQTELSIINVATNQSVGSIIGTSSGVQGTVQIEAGVTYKLKVRAMWKCVETYGSIKYTSAPYDVQINKPVAGARVQKSNDYDGKGNVVTKSYYYGNMACMTCSSGVFLAIDPAAVRNVDIFTQNVTQGKRKVTMYSSPKTPTNSFEGPVVSYTTVIEAEGNDFSRGFTLHKFNPEQDESPAVLCDVMLRGTNYSNGAAKGEELELSKYKKNGNTFTKLYSEINTFYQDSSFDREIPNYTGSLVATNPHTTQNVAITDYYYAFNKYFTRVKRAYQSSKKTTTYDLDGLNPVEQVTNFYYDNPTHLQLTRVETIDSNNISKMEKTYFADDLVGEPMMADLKADNRIGEPVMSETYYNGNKIFAKKAAYIKNAASSNLLLKGSVYSAKFPNNLPSIANIGQMEKNVSFDKYDAVGNILQFTPQDGVPMMYVWGYQKAYPIAKIQNASYASLTTAQQTLISDAQSSSNLDIDPGSEANLKFKLQALQAGFGQSMVTTFVFDPLIGVKAITDPKAATTSFEYDTFGRLITTRDRQSSILSQTSYHFKN